ncbi:MAG: dockerin type I domain-containing protein, partial [Phycisphaerales bacterium]|nr:dockerin type I domain-containing protein [Phycisphaerales bacterium]
INNDGQIAFFYQLANEIQGVAIATPIVACPTDINADGTVNVIDLLAVIAAWGATSGPADINSDGVVNIIDLLAVISAWGPCP